MEWSHESCFNLINKYKEKEVLWNPRHPEYSCKITRENAWKEIATEFEKPLSEVKKKMHNLNSSFRREKRRLRKRFGRRKGNKSKVSDETHGSKWFAYEALQFLCDKDEGGKTANDLDCSDNEELSYEGEESSQVPEEQGESSSLSLEASENGLENTEFPAAPEVALSSEPSQKQFQKLKRKMMDEDSIIAEAFSYLKETVTAVKKPKDRCSLFGELVADKLRSFDNKRKTIAEHKINTILFEMEMSSYGYDHII